MSRNKGSSDPTRIPDEHDSRHWDSVCINFLVLATLVLVGLFTLVGLSDEVLALAKLRNRVVLTGALAVIAYLACLWFGYRSIFAEASDRKRHNVRDVARLLIAEALAVAASAVFVVLVRFEEQSPEDVAAGE